MTNNEIFDKVETHLLTQKKKSRRANRTACAYYGENGLKCAVGCLIPNEHYIPEIEGKRISEPEVQDVLFSAGIPVDEAYEMLASLQDIHDFKEPGQWKNEIAKLRKGLELNKMLQPQTQTQNSMKNVRVESFTPAEALKIGHRRAKGFDTEYALIEYKDGKFNTVAVVRAYWPAENCYACFWLWHPDAYATGSGRAGGYGYDKRAAACAEAICKAGFVFDSSTGAHQTIDLLEAIARHFNLVHYHIHHAHE